MLLSQIGRLGWDWDPFTEMRRMQDEMNRLFRDLEGRLFIGPQSFPPVNLWVGENSLVVTAELPGFGLDDIEVTTREDTLTIRGRRKPQVDADRVAWHRRERLYGDFARSIELPFRVDPERVQARFTNGILEIELQRPEADRPKRIQITAS